MLRQVYLLIAGKKVTGKVPGNITHNYNYNFDFYKIFILVVERPVLPQSSPNTFVKKKKLKPKGPVAFCR
jgi:hypothetical protein